MDRFSFAVLCGILAFAYSIGNYLSSFNFEKYQGLRDLINFYYIVAMYLKKSNF